MLHWWSPVLVGVLVIEIIALAAWWSIRGRLRHGLGAILYWMCAAVGLESIKVFCALAGVRTMDISVVYSLGTAAVVSAVMYRWGAGRWAIGAAVVSAAAAAAAMAGVLPLSAAVASISAAQVAPLGVVLASEIDGPRWGMRSMVVFALLLQHVPTAIFYPWLQIWGSDAPAMLFGVARCAFIASSYLVLYLSARQHSRPI